MGNCSPKKTLKTLKLPLEKPIIQNGVASLEYIFSNIPTVPEFILTHNVVVHVAYVNHKHNPDEPKAGYDGETPCDDLSEINNLEIIKYDIDKTSSVFVHLLYAEVVSGNCKFQIKFEKDINIPCYNHGFTDMLSPLLLQKYPKYKIHSKTLFPDATEGY